MIFLSRDEDWIIFKKNNIMIPNIKGSVGKYIPIPPIENSSIFNDKGVENTTNHISLSRL